MEHKLIDFDHHTTPHPCIYLKGANQGSLALLRALLRWRCLMLCSWLKVARVTWALYLFLPTVSVFH